MVEQAAVKPALEKIVGSPTYDRYLRREQSFIDFRNFAAVDAERSKWWLDFENLVTGKIEDIDFTSEIIASGYTNDRTKFRPYFTVLFTVLNLTRKFEEEFDSLNGITPFAVMHYANISRTGIYRCMNDLADEGYLVKKKVKEDILEWKLISDKARIEDQKGVKLDSIAARRQKDFDRLVRNYYQDKSKAEKKRDREIDRLEKTIVTYKSKRAKTSGVKKLLPVKEKEKFDSQRRRIRKEYETKLKELIIGKEHNYNSFLEKYNALEDELRVSITDEERALWSKRKRLPQDFYAITDKGRDFMRKVQGKYSGGWNHFTELWHIIDKKISGLNLLDENVKLLNLVHIPEKEFSKTTNVFREFLYAWEQLPQDRTLLFELYQAPFTVKAEDGKESLEELSYIGPPIKDSRLLTSVYIDRTGQILSNDGKTTLVLGKYMGDDQQEFKKLAQERSPRYNAVLQDYIRNGKIALANIKPERDNCKSLNLYFEDRVRPFGAKGVKRGAEAVRFYQEASWLEIPEPLPEADAIVFLPRQVDYNNIKWRNLKAD